MPNPESRQASTAKATLRHVAGVVIVAAVFVLRAQEPEPPSPAKRGTSIGFKKGDRERSWRRHFVARDPQKNVAYEGTAITTLTDTIHENIVVLWDTGTARGLRFRHSTNFETKRNVTLVEELAGGSFFRLETDLPLTSHTAEGVMREAQENPVLLTIPDVQMTLITNSIRRTTLETEWNDPVNARAWRTELRSSLAPPLLENLERLRDGMRTASALQSFDTGRAVSLLRQHGSIAERRSGARCRTRGLPLRR